MTHMMGHMICVTPFLTIKYVIGVHFDGKSNLIFERENYHSTKIICRRA